MCERPKGEKGNTIELDTEKEIKPTHWVVKNNVDASNTVSNNTRNPKDEDKMYIGF